MLRHLQLVDDEALLLDVAEDLAHVGVRARLDHSEGRLPLRLLLSGSGYICIASDGENTG